MVKEMKEAYAQWWKEVRPFMINENENLNKKRPFWEEYEKQKAGEGIPEWETPEI